eukprot:sb/3470345/
MEGVMSRNLRLNANPTPSKTFKSTAGGGGGGGNNSNQLRQGGRTHSTTGVTHHDKGRSLGLSPSTTSSTTRTNSAIGFQTNSPRGELSQLFDPLPQIILTLNALFSPITSLKIPDSHYHDLFPPQISPNSPKSLPHTSPHNPSTSITVFSAVSVVRLQLVPVLHPLPSRAPSLRNGPGRSVLAIPGYYTLPCLVIRNRPNQEKLTVT